LPPDPATSAKIDSLAGVLAGEQTSEDRLKSATDFARAQVKLLRIRSVRSERSAKIDLNDCTSGNLRELKRLASLDRYERYALTQRRRSSRGLGRGVNSRQLFAKTNPIFGRLPNSMYREAASGL
jgi:hypothetical protein